MPKAYLEKEVLPLDVVMESRAVKDQIIIKIRVQASTSNLYYMRVSA
jgi:hypothetical protein